MHNDSRDTQKVTNIIKGYLGYIIIIVSVGPMEIHIFFLLVNECSQRTVIFTILLSLGTVSNKCCVY